MSKQTLQEQQISSHKALLQLLGQISKRDQKIAWINAENMVTLRAHAEKEQVMLTKQAELEAMLLHTRIQLAEREAQINEILTSNTWKIAVLFQRIRTFLIPLNSRRARVLQRGLKIILSPFKKIRSK